MNTLNKFIYYPGGENENGSTPASSDASNEIIPDDIDKVEVKEHKTVIEKIKEALHDWSNKDERDQEFDDTRV